MKNEIFYNLSLKVLIQIFCLTEGDEAQLSDEYCYTDSGLIIIKGLKLIIRVLSRRY